MDEMIDINSVDLSRIRKAKITTSAKFNSYTEYDNTCLYFIIDTREIYKGATCFTDVLFPVSVFPAHPTSGKVYFNTRTREVKYWDGVNANWIPLFTPMADTLDDETVNYDTCTVTGRALKNYIDYKFEELYRKLGKTSETNTVPIFESLELAEQYAEFSPLSRPGQCITAPNAEGRMSMYIVQTDKTLVEYPSMDEVKNLIMWKDE